MKVLVRENHMIVSQIAGFQKILTSSLAVKVRGRQRQWKSAHPFTVAPDLKYRLPRSGRLWKLLMDMKNLYQSDG